MAEWLECRPPDYRDRGSESQCLQVGGSELIQPLFVHPFQPALASVEG